MELVGTKVRKAFEGFGTFSGTVESYDPSSGYFKIQYEDGDSEDVDFDEISSIIKEMGGSSPNFNHTSNRGRRPKKRRRVDSNSKVKPSLDANLENDCIISGTFANGSVGVLEENRSSSVPEEVGVDGGSTGELGSEGRRKKQRLLVKEKATPETPLRRSVRRVRNEKPEMLVSQDDDLGGGKEFDPVPEQLSKPELPLSSNDLDVDGLNVFDLFSVYTFLRSFSRLLFLSPFRLETFVAALRCEHANFLIDSIHFSILQALKQHLGSLAEEGSKSASQCLRYFNWDLLDIISWPVFLIHYLSVYASRLKPDLKLRQQKLLDSDYYEQPAWVKLEILRCLCDDVVEVDSIRLELNKRTMDLEGNIHVTNTNMNNDKKRKARASTDPERDSAQQVLVEIDDGNIDECCLCAMDGSLICCDGCPAAFHSRCVGLVKDTLPEGEWYCPECVVEKTDGLVKLSKSFRGAELLGSDPHGRLYFCSCNRLLVSDSWESDASFHYYNEKDLCGVINTLKSCHAYTAIVNAISVNWGFSPDGRNIHYTNEGLQPQENIEPPLSSIKDALSVPNDDMPAVAVSTFPEQAKMNLVNPHEIVESEHPFSCSEPLDGQIDRQLAQVMVSDCCMGSNSPHKEAVSLKLTETVGSAKCIEFPTWCCTIDRRKDGTSEPHFDPGNYINYYVFGRISSSVYAEFTLISITNKSNEPYKSIEDIKSAQVKAVSKKSTKDCWYSYQQLYMDACKENCGWCISCRISGGSDCLFRVACDKNIEISEKNLEGPSNFVVGVRSEKNKKTHITSAIQLILSIEDRVRGFLSGPWEKPHFSQCWQKAVMKASDVASLKPLLISLEINLRRIALSVEWSKPVDDPHAIVSASIVTSPVRASSNQCSNRKQAKKSISVEEFSFISHKGRISDIYWWRGGRLSRQMFQCKMLPRALASTGGRQAGGRKISHVSYPDGSDLAKRNKYVSWRVAVEMSQSVAQLIYQVKDFDSNIKWAELSDTRLFPQLGKESKKVRPFKKVTIRKKCKEGKQVKYLLEFGKKGKVPPLVARHGVLLEESSDRRKSYWLNETLVPLYLIKSYEERKIDRLLKKADSRKKARLLKKTDSGKDRIETGSGCKIKKRKKSEWFSYLVSREKESEKQICGHCNKDILAREAVNCQFCDGFFHRKHFRVPKGAITTTYTCSKCKDIKSVSVKVKGVKIKKIKVKGIESIEGMSKEMTGDKEDKNMKNVSAKDKEKMSMNVRYVGTETTDVKGEVIENGMVIPRKCRSLRLRAREYIEKSEGRAFLTGKRSNSVESTNAADQDLRRTDVNYRSMERINSGDKNAKNIIAEDIRSRMLRPRETISLTVRAQAHKAELKSRKISTSKKSAAESKKRKYVLMKFKKKSNGQKRSNKAKSRNDKPEQSETVISWYTQKRSVLHHSYWLNGLFWTQKPDTEHKQCFRETNILLPFQHVEDSSMKPLCSLCSKEYNPGVIYISCEKCQDWFHGDAFCLTVDNVNKLIGFRCHKCRMRSAPVCPFLRSALTGAAVLDTEFDIGLNIACDGHKHEEKLCSCYIACNEDNLDKKLRVIASIEDQNGKDKLHISLSEDRSAIINNGVKMGEAQCKEGLVHLEEELGFDAETPVINGQIPALHYRNNEENARQGTCDDIFLGENLQDKEKRGKVLVLSEDEPSLHAKTISANLSSDQPSQQAVASAAASEDDDEIVVE